MDPSAGHIELDGTDLRGIAFDALRRRVVLVPQEGYLFDATLLSNVRYGRLGATTDEVHAAVTELGLADWLAGLPMGLDTRVGQRGESMSAGERQLVALIRAHLADPDLLVLDEATSAVDPELEVRIGRALEALMNGRTSVTIAHRLTTAENADEVIVFDKGRVVQRGPHDLLVAEGGVYGRLHASWVAQSSSQSSVTIRSSAHFPSSQLPASSAASSSQVRSATAPMPLDVRSTLLSWTSTRTPSALACTSVSMPITVKQSGTPVIASPATFAVKQ